MAPEDREPWTCSLFDADLTTEPWLHVIATATDTVRLGNRRDPLSWGEGEGSTHDLRDVDVESPIWEEP